MSSQDNVQTLREMYAAFKQGDSMASWPTSLRTSSVWHRVSANFRGVERFEVVLRTVTV